jgi:hypothetical protein
MEYAKTKSESMLRQLINAAESVPGGIRESGEDIIHDFRQHYSSTGMIQASGRERVWLGKLAWKVETVSERMRAGGNLDRVLEAFDRIELELYGKVRRGTAPVVLPEPDPSDKEM